MTNVNKIVSLWKNRYWSIGNYNRIGRTADWALSWTPTKSKKFKKRRSLNFWNRKRTV